MRICQIAGSILSEAGIYFDNDEPRTVADGRSAWYSKETEKKIERRRFYHG